MSPDRNHDSELSTLGVTRMAAQRVAVVSDQAGARPTSKSEHRSVAPVLVRAGLLVIAFAGVVVIAAACDRGPSAPGVAALSQSSSSTAPAPAIRTGAGTSTYELALTFSDCMRSHGVTNFPDPSSSGEFNDDEGAINGQNVDTSSPQFSVASKACRQLLPNGGQPTPAEQQQALSQALKYVQCMRAHGVAMRDPSTSGGGVGIGLGVGVDPNSTQFQAAEQACRSFEPGGEG